MTTASWARARRARGGIGVTGWNSRAAHDAGHWVLNHSGRSYHVAVVKCLAPQHPVLLRSFVSCSC
jgi:hypothetical protein